MDIEPDTRFRVAPSGERLSIPANSGRVEVHLLRERVGIGCITSRRGSTLDLWAISALRLGITPEEAKRRAQV